MSDKRKVSLIDANALCEGLVSNHPVVIAAKCAPTIDAEPVRHGRWIQRKTIPDFHHCSICGVAHKMQASCNKYLMLRYCPHCGAKMDGGKTMKTPDEIKIGLGKCYGTQSCAGCPYYDLIDCNNVLIKDALTYIEQLEERISLNDLRDAIYEDAVKHGLWDRHYGPAYCAELIHDEASELDLAAMDWERDDNDDSEFCEELADVIIMCLSVAGNLGIDIDAAVRGKMEINKARPWKHGKEENDSQK